ncbi:hypothetical protein [Streptomyces sp. NPDC087307]|uniref:hypothetical protein n=1 Tax=Streptomyces sp. NPDC087307 TaxID=3365782 RepID=UPI003823F95C
MPTYEATPRFTADHHRLTPDQRRRFHRIVTRNGRATWSYGEARIQGAQHIVWRRIGTHDILTGP